MINLPKMTAHRRLHIQNQVCLTVKIVVFDQTFHKNDAISDKEKNLCAHLCFKGGKILFGSLKWVRKTDSFQDVLLGSGCGSLCCRARSPLGRGR